MRDVGTVIGNVSFNCRDLINGPSGEISIFLREVKTAGRAKDVAEQGSLPILTAYCSCSWAEVGALRSLDHIKLFPSIAIACDERCKRCLSRVVHSRLGLSRDDTQVGTRKIGKS
jgi:hypothetical protein